MYSAILLSLPFSNDAITLGLLICILAAIFYTSSLENPGWKRFYTFVPSLLLCYFIPALFNWPFGIITGEGSNLYYVASRYLLPASLILFCLGIDFKGLLNLGPKAIIMFLAASVGIIIGGPIALLVASSIMPDVIGASTDDLWKGLSTIAGSWIGGGANQTAMKEIYEVSDNLFGTMIVVDVVVANIWMGFLLYGANISDKIDEKLGADNSAISELKQRISDYRANVEEMPTVNKLFTLMAIAFGGVAIAHLGSELIVPIMENNKETLQSLNITSLTSSFFWIVVISTTFGLTLSFTKARKLEGVGASRWGSIFIYVLVATIGMKMNLGEVFDNLGLFAIGIIWMLIHVIILLIVAYFIKAPFFYVAVGCQANIGGAASAPIVAAAFSPSLAPVSVDGSIGLCTWNIRSDHLCSANECSQWIGNIMSCKRA